jgi:FG-GAP-like repeat
MGAMAAPSDFSGDGKSDLIFRNNSTGQINAWLMNGGTRTADAALVGAGNWSVSHTADFNGDGKADILFRNDDGSVTVWLMNGLNPIGQIGLIGADPNWRVTHVGDFNGDGKADLLWQNTNGAVTLWLMDGTTVISRIGLLGATAEWSVSHVADFNGDGKADLLWRNTNGAVTIWLMNGGSAISTAGILGATSVWRVSHTADLNGDGKADLLWRSTDGSVSAWLMNGTSQISNAALLGANPDWSVSHTADFNGDGKTDLLWRNTNGAVTIWQMNGFTNIGAVGLLGADPNWRVTHIGDYNGDGRSDVVWRNAADGSIAMWLINGAAVISQTTILGGSPWVVVPQTPTVPLVPGTTGMSTYSRLSSDVQVNVTPVGLLNSTIFLPNATWVYVQSDGRYFPQSTAFATAHIEVNGTKISNDSSIDWRGSTRPNQHSFNVIGAAYLSAGTHTFTLKGATLGAPVIFGAGTNLSVLITKATSINNLSSIADTQELSFNTVGVPEGVAIPTTAFVPLLSTPIGNSTGPIVALASGSSFPSGKYGDGMFGIFLNNAEPNIDSMTWSINDLWTGAELQAPMFSQALFTSPPVNSSVQLIASEAPYYIDVVNSVQYKVRANTRLVTLSGSAMISGKALTPGYPYISQGLYRRFAYVCIGTNGFNPGCPVSGTEIVVGEGQVCIPSGHSGEVLFSAKTRVQGDQADGGGTLLLTIKIDGIQVGQIGVQQIGPQPDAVSARTISASYLSAGAKRLSEGCHTVQAIGQAIGDFRNVSMNADMPLVWFD